MEKDGHCYVHLALLVGPVDRPVDVWPPTESQGFPHLSNISSWSSLSLLFATQELSRLFFSFSHSYSTTQCSWECALNGVVLEREREETGRRDDLHCRPARRPLTAALEHKHLIDLFFFSSSSSSFKRLLLIIAAQLGLLWSSVLTSFSCTWSFAPFHASHFTFYRSSSWRLQLNN